MKHLIRLMIATVPFATLGIIFLFVHKVKTEKKLDKIAQEGYETAEDILYPLRSQRYRRV